MSQETTSRTLSYTLRHPPTNGLPPLQPCCGKHHAMPFQHVKFLQDKRGRTRHAYECSACYKTLAQRGQRPGNIRWAEPRSSLCKACREEQARELDARAEALKQGALL